METPSLEKVEVWGLLGLAGLGALAVYALYRTGQSASTALAEGWQSTKDAVSNAVGVNGPPVGTAGATIGPDASAQQQFVAAAHDIPNPVNAVINGLTRLYNWAWPQRGVDASPASSVPGTGQSGNYFAGDQTSMPGQDPTIGVNK